MLYFIGVAVILVIGTATATRERCYTIDNSFSNFSHCDFRLTMGNCLSCDNTTSAVYSGSCFVDLSMLPPMADLKSGDYFIC